MSKTPASHNTASHKNTASRPENSSDDGKSLPACTVNLPDFNSTLLSITTQLQRMESRLTALDGQVVPHRTVSTGTDPSTSSSPLFSTAQSVFTPSFAPTVSQFSSVVSPLLPSVSSVPATQGVPLASPALVGLLPGSLPAGYATADHVDPSVYSTPPDVLADRRVRVILELAKAKDQNIKDEVMLFYLETLRPFLGNLPMGVLSELNSMLRTHVIAAHSTWTNVHHQAPSLLSIAGITGMDLIKPATTTREVPSTRGRGRFRPTTQATRKK